MKKHVTMKPLFNFVLFGLIIFLVAIPINASAAKPIKFGVLGPMKFVQGKHAWWAAEIAADEVNSGGGINVGGVKRPVKLVKVNTNEILSTVDATNAVERAITREKVDFLIGACSSGSILAMQDVAMEYKKIFLLGGSGSHPEITKRVKRDYDTYKYFFRPQPMNAMNIVPLMVGNVEQLARIVKEHLGIEKPKVALLFEAAKWLDPQIPYYEKIFPQKGIEVAGLWRMSTKDLDVSSQLSAIRSSKAHIILAMSSGPVAIPMYRQMGELEIPAALTGVNVAAEGGKFWEATGGQAAYQAVTTSFGRVAFTKRSIPFYDKFVDRFKEIPVLTTGTYDAILMLQEAIEKAGTLDPDALVPVLEKADFQSTKGRVVFDDSHDPIFGPGYLLGAAFQWLPNGEKSVWWPNGWKGVKYEGVVDFKLSPWMIKYWKGKN